MDGEGPRESLRERWIARCLAHPRLTVVGVVVGTFALLLIIASALVWSVPSRSGSGSGRSHTPAILESVGVLILGVVILVTTISYTLRRARRTREVPCSQQRRSQVEKTLRRGGSISARDMPVAASIVRALHPPWLHGLIAAGVVLPQLWLLLFDNDDVPSWSVAAIGLVVVGFGVSVWHYHRLVRNFRRLNSRTTGA